MAEVEIDKLPTHIGIPEIQEDAMSGDGPFKASIEVQEQLGFPGEKVENWQQVAIEKMAEITSKYRSVQVFLDACVKCGACAWLELRNLMMQCLMIGITTFINALSVVVAQFSVLMASIQRKFQWQLGR